MDDIDIKRLNFDFASELEFWLKTERNCAHNTTMKYISNLKKIVNSCIRKGWLEFFAVFLRHYHRTYIFLPAERISDCECAGDKCPRKIRAPVICQNQNASITVARIKMR